MRLTPDAVDLKALNARVAARDYSRIFGRSGESVAEGVILKDAGALRFTTHDAASDGAAGGFSGFALAVIVEQPNDVESLATMVGEVGGKTVKPAKKQFFGDFSGSYVGPEGTPWKISARKKKNSAAAATEADIREVAVFLGVDKPKISKAFYETLGMTTRYDYGDKFVDFDMPAGTFRLGLLPRHGLAKDLGIQDSGQGNDALTLVHFVSSREEADVLFRRVSEAGGTVVVRNGGRDGESPCGEFIDPDGYTWTIELVR